MTSLTAVPMAAESGWLASIEDTINSWFEPIAYWSTTIIFYPIPFFGTEAPIVTFWLVAAGLIFTIYYGAVQFRGFKTSLEVVRGRYSHKADEGEVTHFQALTAALSGTVGLGNIAGVGVAVVIGGPGATFWMILAGLLGMATKFAECTLGVRYREVHEDGSVTGGPFRYLPIAFARFGRLPAKVLTGIYAVAIMLFGVAGGNMFQANQTFAQAQEVTGGDDGFLGSDGAALIFGLILAGLVAAVIIGGIKSIARVTSKLVPAMAIIYVTACLIVIFRNVDQIPGAIADIITGAFNPSGVAGGVVGVVIVGFQRAAFSNEAGLGSAAIAHSPVKTRRPVSEGFVALLEPFIDTVIICTMTALTIIIAAPTLYTEALTTEDTAVPDGVVVTSEAFETVIPDFPVILAVAVALFAFSTLITWSYYGLRAWTTLFGRSTFSENLFKLIFCLFTVTGTVLTFDQVLGFADSMLFLCAFVNLAGVYLLMPVVKREMKEYFADRKSGELSREAAEPPPTKSGAGA
ncbi:MAG: alanine:cation symporter family protein [Nocardioidaceae bacterium]|jgi:AGCS family alanine or glycine:cation symporter|nr:alanine:cation symporter family protein [Nocardioidaceae bacterium]